ncbi:hypothetical protein [uncultured Winogradskyella sp.]|uniref:hypothetical protein n=1 Tax=uncultured Winogradskyella sp. TaxID=395353 RepID=UPI0030EE768D|tara:strand:+ start:1142 stop:2026 length:885 start_codon:yes stop_codon:yes gene_type:complete
MNEIIKRILVIIILTTSFSIFSQETNGSKEFEEYVFRNTTIGYDTIGTQLLVPTFKTISRRRCNIERNPLRFECSTNIGFPSKTFITQFEKSDDFNVSVFNPDEKIEESDISITSFIRDGKVVQQSFCIYNGQMTAGENNNSNKNHYTISTMKCYVITPELADVLMRITSLEKHKDPKLYKEFVNVLKSNKYKKAVMESHIYNWRQTFLSLNSDEEQFTFKYISKLKKGFYDHKKYVNNEKLGVVNLENQKFVKDSKSLYEVFTKENTLMGKIFYQQSKNLTESKLMAEIKTEK